MAKITQAQDLELRIAALRCAIDLVSTGKWESADHRLGGAESAYPFLLDLLRNPPKLSA